MLDRLSQSPRLWNILRRMVENNFRGEKRVIARELKPGTNTDQRWFLDVGCGTGEFAPQFDASRYVGIDLFRPYLRFAVQTYVGYFIASDATALALPNQRFDAVLVLGILHHLPDDAARAVMIELHRVVHPGGIVLIMEDIPPPDIWNIGGHLMHWLDRGGFIRTEGDYRTLFGNGFAVLRSYHMRSGICDYGVYVLQKVT